MGAGIETITREDLIEEPTEQTVMDRYNGWVFKVKQSSPLSQLTTKDLFWYRQNLYQPKQIERISAAPEDYVEVRCIIGGVMPPDELLPR